MAGNGAVLGDVHNHFGDALAHSMAIGGNLWESFSQQHEMAGPVPRFFFAPAQIEKRTRDWGAGEPMRRIGEVIADYVTFADAWLEIDHTTGREMPSPGRGTPRSTATWHHTSDSSVQ